MNNAEVVAALPELALLRQQRKDLDSEIEQLERRCKRLRAQRTELDANIGQVASVTRVLDGIALNETSRGTIYGKGCTIHGVGDDTSRTVEIYSNANTHKNGVASDWCIQLQEQGTIYERRQDNWLGNGFGFADACDIGRNWVVHGTVPDEKQIAMFLFRHRLDPERRLRKTRHQAFEAAWLAGQETLAVQLLAPRAKAKTKRKR